jgi:hypothetical protein
VAPVGVVAAQLGHADTRMTEKHYAHLAPSYVAQTHPGEFSKARNSQRRKSCATTADKRSRMKRDRSGMDDLKRIPPPKVRKTTTGEKFAVVLQGAESRIARMYLKIISNFCAIFRPCHQACRRCRKLISTPLLRSRQQVAA